MKQDKTEQFSMLDECVNSYFAENINDDEFEIKIRAPKKYCNIWLAKLTDLHTTVKEIEEYQQFPLGDFLEEN